MALLVGWFWRVDAVLVVHGLHGIEPHLRLPNKLRFATNRCYGTAHVYRLALHCIDVIIYIV